MSPSHRLLVLFTVFATSAFPLQAIYAQTPRPNPTAPNSGAPNTGLKRQSISPEQYQAAVENLKECIGTASTKVFNAIRNQENAVLSRFEYFRKPDRLNPASFASKEEIQSWKSSLTEWRTAMLTLENMYTSAEFDFGNELAAQKLPPSLANPIKKELIASFPWETIHKRNELMDRYLDEHERLLNLYFQNWNQTAVPPAIQLTDPKIAAQFKTLSAKIRTDGNQIQELYRKM
jgi:hypothetical protein